MNYDIEARTAAKMNSYDRVIVLEPIEGTKTLSASGGAVDARLFNGENNLHAIYDIQKGWWYLKYDKSSIPGALDQSFSDFDNLLTVVHNYYQKRNVRVAEVRM